MHGVLARRIFSFTGYCCRSSGTILPWERPKTRRCDSSLADTPQSPVFRVSGFFLDFLVLRYARAPTHVYVSYAGEMAAVRRAAPRRVTYFGEEVHEV